MYAQLIKNIYTGTFFEEGVDVGNRLGYSYEYVKGIKLTDSPKVEGGKIVKFKDSKLLKKKIEDLKAIKKPTEEDKKSLKLLQAIAKK